MSNAKRWGIRGFWAILGLLAVSAIGCKDRNANNGITGDPSGPGSAPPASDEIVIGAYLSMTGDMADFGVKTKNGLELAIEEINRAGGLHGKQVRLVALDDQGRADEAGSAVTRLIDVNNAVAIVGEVASSLSLVGGRVAQRRGIPMVSPSSTNTTVTEVGDHVFRVCFIDPFQGLVMARFARENLHVTRVAILKDVRNDYSVGLAQSFEQEWTRAGGTIIATQSYSAGDTDFSAQLTALKEVNPDAIYIPGYYTEVGNIARQARRLGINAKLLGGDGWDSPQLREIGGPDIIGAYYSNHFAADNPTPRAASFIAAYRAKYNEVPSGLAALGYDAMLVLADAIRRAPEPTPAAITAALAQTRGLEVVTGTITLDEHRNPIKPAVVVRVTAEGDVFEAAIAPGDAPAQPTAPGTTAPTGAAAPTTGTTGVSAPTGMAENPPSGASANGPTPTPANQ